MFDYWRSLHILQGSTNDYGPARSSEFGGGKAANSTDESSIIILVLLKTAINGGIQQSLEATYSVTGLVWPDDARLQDMACLCPQGSTYWGEFCRGQKAGQGKREFIYIHLNAWTDSDPIPGGFGHWRMGWRQSLCGPVRCPALPQNWSNGPIGFPYAIRPWSFPRWRAGISSGYGVLTSQGGKRSFRGQFLHAKKHGRGIFTWPDGSADLREKTWEDQGLDGGNILMFFFGGGRLGREHYQTDLSIGFCIKKIARLDLQSVNFGIQGILLVISGLRLSRMVAWNVYPSVDGSSFFFQGEHRGHYQLDVASGFGTFSWQGPQGFVA